MRKVMLLVALLCLVGCVTKPPKTDQLRVPTSDRLLALQDRFADAAIVVVTRDVGALGGGCYAAVFMDGKVVAKLGTGERASFYVTPGDHIVGTWSTGEALCGIREGSDRREASANLKANETKKYRITITPGVGLDITPTTL